MKAAPISPDEQKRPDALRHDQLAQFFSISVDLLGTADFKGYFKTINPAFEKLLGYSLAELTEIPFTSFIHPEDIGRTQDEMKKLEAGAVTLHFLNRYKAKDGRYFTLDWAAKPDLEDQLIYFSARNVTDQLRKYQEIVEMARFSTIGQMAAGMAHEINNPLTIISLSTVAIRAALEGGNQAKLERLLEKQNHAVDRIKAITQAMEKFASKGVAPPSDGAAVLDSWKTAQELIQVELGRQNIQIEADVSTEIRVQCYPTSLSQIFMILLQNSVESLSHREKKTIQISATRLESTVCIRFSDSGPPLSPEIQEKLMTPFFSTKPVGGGVGMSLSVCKGLIEHHQGRFYYDPKASNVSFIIELPHVTK